MGLIFTLPFFSFEMKSNKVQSVDKRWGQCTRFVFVCVCVCMYLCGMTCQWEEQNHSVQNLSDKGDQSGWKPHQPSQHATCWSTWYQYGGPTNCACLWEYLFAYIVHLSQIAQFNNSVYVFFLSCTINVCLCLHVLILCVRECQSLSLQISGIIYWNVEKQHFLILWVEVINLQMPAKMKWKKLKERHL